MLQQEEHRQKSLHEICQLAGYLATDRWYEAIKDEHFVEALEALGVKVHRNSPHGKAHTAVMLATSPLEVLEGDSWDMRLLKPDYPKHLTPSQFVIDFSRIANPLLRQQVKSYFRAHLPKWKASSFRSKMTHLRPFLVHLSPELDIETMTRSHIEALLLSIAHLSNYTVRRCLFEARKMLEYMATSPAWTGPRPQRFLIRNEDFPPEPDTLPRPIPPDVLDQLDLLLEQATQLMKAGQTPSFLPPTVWDALVILRHTGMRYEDLAHLKAPDAQDRHGCLEQDSEGYWWIRIAHHNNKMGKDHRIPTKLTDGVVDAIHRQRERVKALPDHFEAHYLFRSQQGIYTYGGFVSALGRLGRHLTHEGHPYTITPHQFRHTIATDMIEQGVDIYTVKEFLGHASLQMTERYVQVYLKSLKAKYDAYRVKKQQTYASEMMANQVQMTQPQSDVDGGWVEGKVGKLYLSPLPDGIGNCAHLAMLDPCPDVPHCPTCPKLRANKRHLPVWESKATNLLITVEALRANPAYARARQKHEQELAHAEKVIKIIKEEGFWDGRIHNSQANTH